MTAAWQVEEKVKQVYFWLTYVSLDEGDPYWECSFDPDEGTAEGITAAHAICLAALKAMEGKGYGMSDQPESNRKDTGMRIMGLPVLVDPSLSPGEWRLELAHKKGGVNQRETRYIIGLDVYIAKNLNQEQREAYDEILLKLCEWEEGDSLDLMLTTLATAPLVNRCLALLHVMGVFNA